MTKALTVAPTDTIVIDREAILKALKLDPRDANTHALVLTCQRYGLDPYLKHAVLIQGSLYVTRDGLMHVAHASGKFDGIEVEMLPETPSHFVARARVWRKDMTHPFVYTGRYPKGGRGGPGAQYGPEMAEKVAECRALRRAFAIGLCSREEAWDMDEREVVHQPDPREQKEAARDAALAEFVAACEEQGVQIGSGASAKRKTVEMIARAYGIDTESVVIPKTAEQWQAATEAVRVMSSVEEVVVSESVGEELTDPFAEGEE